MKKVGLGFIALLALIGLAAPVLAAQGSDLNLSGTLGNFSNLNSTLTTLFRFVIGLAGIIFLVLFLVGGVQYLTAAGNEEQTGKAKRLLVDAIVGLIIVLSAFAIGNFILARLGLNVSTQNQSTTNTIETTIR